MTDEHIEDMELIDEVAEDFAEESEMDGDAEKMEMPDMRPEDILRYSISMFNEIAWVKMGARANPSNGKITTDLSQAKLAIDAIAALAQLTEGRFEVHEVRDIKNLVSSLQMNYVQRKTAQEE